jgi:molybdopterin converting factor small subunit
MRIEVLLFGPASQAAGCDRIGVECAVAGGRAGPTAASVLEAIAAQHPELEFAIGSARLAVNHAFAPRETVVAPTDEVALVALVGGG